jgi:hypothetical protein
MSGKGGSSLGTLLFSVPLAAIPLMAIFGIPQFAPLVASPERTSGYDRHPDERPFDRRRSGDELRDEELDPEFADVSPDERAADRRSRRDPYAGRDQRPAIRDEQHEESLASAWPPESRSDREAPAEARGAEDRRQSRPAAPLDNASAFAEAAATPVAAGLTWQTAAQRFEELGITSYHLEPGSESASFLFVCSFCPAANPNVTMRFESEAAEPLDAVDDVLAQIDRWQQ